MSNPKTCATCKHLYLQAGDQGYSEFTPGSDMSLGCGKDHWTLDQFADYTDELRSKLLTAIDCKDYVEVKQPVDGKRWK